MWSDEELVRWIWEAMRDVARRTECLQETRSITLVSGQQTYDLPPDMFRIYRVEYRQTSTYNYPLTYQDFATMDELWLTNRSSQGTPEFYTIWGTPGQGSEQLYLYPVPSSDITDGLKLYYYRLPKKVDTNDYNKKADIPAGWEDLVPLYVEIVARRKESRDSRWKEAYELYEIRLAEMMKTTRHWTDQPTYFASGGRPNWLTGGGDW